MVAPVTMGRTDEIVFAVVVIAILVMWVFGLDAIIFRNTKRAKPVNRTIPKHRVTYIFEDDPDESDADVPRRSRR